MPQDATYRLISFHLCPFVQRSVILLQEKGVAYQVEYIDLSAKPQWFLDISPFGKVPVLRVGDAVLFESAAINEYLDETAGETRLHPADPLLRAQHRAWIEFASTMAMSTYKLILAPEEAAALAALEKVRALVARLDRQLGPEPWFSGSEFSLVDAAMAPTLQRLQWCREWATAVDAFVAAPKVEAWMQALLQRPSVQRSTVPDIGERFATYLRGNRGVNKQHEPPSWLTVVGSVP